MDIISKIKNTEQALQEVFSNLRYQVITTLLTFLIFTFVVLLPVGRFNERALYYQLISLDKLALLSMFFFSVVFAVSFSMNIYLFTKKHLSKKKTFVSGLFSLLSAFGATIFGSSACLACLSLLIGFVGLPFISSILIYQKQLFVISAIVSLISVYLTSKAIIEEKTCKVCKVR
ncbi:MAG: hypothetical protein AABX38_04670 [Candidatus Micrarchaeota archaeon]